MKTPTRDLVSNWVPVLAWMLVIFTASSDLGSSEHTARFLIPLLFWFNPHLTASGILTAQLVVRKAGHLTEYAVLAMLLLRAVGSWFPAGLVRQAGLTLLIAAIYASSDEFHQLFVPTRTASFEDVLIDCAGAVLGVFVYRFLGYRPAAVIPELTSH